MSGIPAPKSSLFWRLFNTSVKGHTAIFRLTGGRVGGRMVGGPILLLHHVGAKSGKERISPLLYLPDGERMVIVASKGGYTKHPGWFHNLKANPDTTIQIGTENRKVHARVATGDERDELFNKAAAAYSGYKGYQARTERKIPVVVLERR